MKVIIVGHRSRLQWATQLQRHLGNDCILYVDHSDRGALHSHLQALRIAVACEERCVIMEDDAIPVVGFKAGAEMWMRCFPDDAISFYLGTSRPPQWQPIIEQRLAQRTVDYIELGTLIHGVCYSIPRADLQRTIDRTQECFEGADASIGLGFGRPVIYPVESLVEHRDGAPVERPSDGQPRNQPRVARQLAGPLAYDR